MKTFTLTFALLIFTSALFSQVAPDKYFVRFTDKNNSPYSIDNPAEYLSQKAIDRRTNQGIPVELSDLPVNPSYLQGVKDAGATILNPSKWLNGVSIYTTDPAVLAEIEALPYVAGITMPQKSVIGEDPAYIDYEKSFFSNETFNKDNGSVLKQAAGVGAFDYGFGYNQIQMLGGDDFHEMGFRGQGKVIAILDAGFLNANTLSVFDSIWQNGQVLGTHDFVRGGDIQFDEHVHGSMVLSCIAANIPGQLIGTAPKASFWLFRSEDGDSEYIIEEYNWVSAAERADSVGADVINSSLGYSEFNDPAQNHTYSNMDGNTCPATIGADMAARKGILVVNSLGNEGSSAWYYLSAPSDGDSVLGIGAVDGEGNYASFSSHGPSYDGRVKPDIAAQGSGVCIVDPYSGGLTFGGGTSFSSPILAGMSACLWQANPSLSNMQIAQAIRQSATQYENPDEMLGYGIPDFILANNILTVINGPDADAGYFNIYPNPVTETFTVDASSIGNQINMNSGECRIEIRDVTGRLVGSQVINLQGTAKTEVTILQNAPGGLYFAAINLPENQFVQKIVKQ